MNPMINTYQMSVGDREFILADVSRSAGLIGTTKITAQVNEQTLNWGGYPVTELFYADNEALINLTRPARGDEYSEKMVHQISTISVCDENIKAALSSVSDSYFTYSQSMTKSLHPVFELLSEGIYVCHESKMIPSDGSGTFFWTAYAIRRELAGSANYNRTMGKESNYTPCFLLPTTGFNEFSEAKVRTQREKMKQGKRIGGLAYHVSGMFSALLDGHHSSAACLLTDTDFRCIVIEPLRDLLYESAEQAAEYGREPRITALSCPYVKIPLSLIPPPMLESFLLRRSGTLPKSFSDIIRKAGKSLRTTGKKAIPREILVKAELLPDSSMVESAHAVTGLSDEQLEALLSGETKYEDEVIISGNYYNSIVTACNYLQYEDFERFLKFTEDIVLNPNLTATHKYVIERLCAINDISINSLFSDILEKGDPMYREYIPQLESYVKNYAKYESDNITDKNQRAQRLNKAIGLLDGEMNSVNLAQMEAIVKQSKRH